MTPRGDTKGGLGAHQANAVLNNNVPDPLSSALFRKGKKYVHDEITTDRVGLPHLNGDVKLNHGVADRKFAFADGNRVIDVSLGLYIICT